MVLPLEKQEDIIERDLQKARESEARMQRIALEERVKLYAMRMMGYSILERTMKVIANLNDEQLSAIARTVEGKNLAAFTKSMADVVKSLPTATEKQSMEITKKVSQLGDAELEKRHTELQVTLKRKGLI